MEPRLPQHKFCYINVQQQQSMYIVFVGGNSLLLFFNYKAKESDDEDFVCIQWPSASCNI